MTGVAVALDAAANLEAVHFRQHDVEQHEVRPLLFAQREGLLAIDGFEDLEAARFENGAHEQAFGGEIVNDQDFHRVGGWRRDGQRVRQKWASADQAATAAVVSSRCAAASSLAPVVSGTGTDPAAGAAGSESEDVVPAVVAGAGSSSMSGRALR